MSLSLACALSLSGTPQVRSLGLAGDQGLLGFSFSWLLAAGPNPTTATACHLCHAAHPPLPLVTSLVGNRCEVLSFVWPGPLSVGRLVVGAAAQREDLFSGPGLRNLLLRRGKPCLPSWIDHHPQGGPAHPARDPQ
uniref:Uncharacterized protein n=1 Tax=Pipistrellus kuhlii TaxID=59472 RepID=A0A7J7VML7_PIPKU|nr:hypothetical protein mPipKuh1_008407 [Pipistrellus kuhlii]